jgi:hypothetical protein
MRTFIDDMPIEYRSVCRLALTQAFIASMQYQLATGRRRWSIFC